MMSKRENKTQISGEPETIDTAVARRILQETAEDILPASPDVFARIEQAITSTPFSENTSEVPPSSLLAPLVERLRNLIVQPGFAWGVAAAQAIVLCLFFAFSPGSTTYQTLSGNQISQQEDITAPTFTVIFQDNATIGAVETLLKQVGATIINGPGRRGIYTITLASAGKTSRDEALKNLQHSSLITFIEEAY